MDRPVELTLDTLRAELVGLELRVVDRITHELDKKADRSHVEALERDLSSIKTHGSPSLIATQQMLQETSRKVGDVERELAVRSHITKELSDAQRDVADLEARTVLLERDAASLGSINAYRRWVLGLALTTSVGLLGTVATLVWLAVG